MQALQILIFNIGWQMCILDSGCISITFQIAKLKYTHLGEIHSYSSPGII